MHNSAAIAGLVVIGCSGVAAATGEVLGTAIAGSATAIGATLGRRLWLAARSRRAIARRFGALAARVSANASTDRSLFKAIADGLFELFPQATRTGILRITGPERRELKLTDLEVRRGAPPRTDLTLSHSLVAQVCNDGRGLLVRRSPTPSHPRGTIMAVPVRVGEKTYGVMFLESSVEPFGALDLSLLRKVAVHTGQCLRDAELQRTANTRARIDRDLAVAKQIQRSLLPASPPAFTGIELACHYKPAFQVGGDFYDFVVRPPRQVGIIVGDVSGKAVSGVLYMARLSSELRASAHSQTGPAAALEKLNESMVTLGAGGMFATAIYCEYDAATKRLTYTSAGHGSPLIRRGPLVHEVSSPRAEAPPIGIIAPLRAGQAYSQLRSGDIVVLTTDGVVEARDEDGTFYGPERLHRAVSRAPSTAQAVIDSIVQDVGAFCGGSQSDDITIVALAIL